MFNSLVEGVITIALAIIGLAIISVILSKQSNTAGVLQAGASGLGNDIAVAESPVSGASVSPNLSYSSNQFGNLFGS